MVFFLTAGAFAMATLTFTILARGEEQAWASDRAVTMETKVTDSTNPLSVNNGEMLENSEELQVSVNSGNRGSINGDIVGA